MENFANNFVTTLAAAIGATDTSVQVDSSAGSPAANFRILIESEYMLVTAKSGNTWTVTRGIEGSIAIAHAATYTNTSGQIVATEVAQVLTVVGLKTLIQQSISYSHQQNTALTVWTITHNLGRFPSIVVTDNLNNVLICDVFYVDANIVQVIHGIALIGNAYCN